MVLYYTIVKWLLAVYRQTSEFESILYNIILYIYFYIIYDMVLYYSTMLCRCPGN